MRGKGKCLSALCAMPDHPRAFVGRCPYPCCCSAGAVELAFEGRRGGCKVPRAVSIENSRLPDSVNFKSSSVRGSFFHKIW